jgi:hypothetical protein
MTRPGLEPRAAAVGSQRLTAWAMARPPAYSIVSQPTTLPLAPTYTKADRLLSQSPLILCSTKFYYRAHNSPPLIPIEKMSFVRYILQFCFKVYFNINFLFMPMSCKWSHQAYVLKFVCSSLTCHSCYIFHPSHPRHDNPNNVWRGVQVMKLLTMHFSPISYCFIPLFFPLAL